MPVKILYRSFIGSSMFLAALNGLFCLFILESLNYYLYSLSLSLPFVMTALVSVFLIETMQIYQRRTKSKPELTVTFINTPKWCALYSLFIALYLIPKFLEFGESLITLLVYVSYTPMIVITSLMFSHMIVIGFRIFTR